MYKDCFSRDDLKRILNLNVSDCVDVLFSHNSVIALWIADMDDNSPCRRMLWRGMAWNIPSCLSQFSFVTFFGVLPQAMMESDTLNIEVACPEGVSLPYVENQLRIIRVVEEENRKIQEENSNSPVQTDGC